MSDPENFVSRWARLKRESTEADASSHEKVSLPVPPELIAPPAAVVDPASLPTVAEITTESDMAMFLQAGVPNELVRAALRAAWVVDPAIRDFVGIAESQWDFNDPAAMAGFGPLLAGDQEASLASRLLSTSVNAVVANAAVPSLEDRPATNPIGAVHDRRVDSVWLSAGMAKETPPTLEEDSREAAHSVMATERRAETVELSGDASRPRRHGGAMPKLTA